MHDSFHANANGKIDRTYLLILCFIMSSYSTRYKNTLNVLKHDSLATYASYPPPPPPPPPRVFLTAFEIMKILVTAGKIL